MPPELPPSGSPADWLRHAHSDLALAQVSPTPEILLEGLCFHAQQAAEKALKAVLIANNVSFPRTHNLRTLLDLLPSGIDVPSAVENAASLTEYAVSSRYPGVVEPIEQAEYQEAIVLAEAVIQWAKQSLKSED